MLRVIELRIETIEQEIEESSVPEYFDIQISQCVSSVHTPTAVQCTLAAQS